MSDRAAIPTTVAMAPVISAAARTRPHVSLMFLPPSVDTSIKGFIGIRKEDTKLKDAFNAAIKWIERKAAIWQTGTRAGQNAAEEIAPVTLQPAT